MDFPTSTRLLEFLNTKLGRFIAVMALILIVGVVSGRFIPKQGAATANTAMPVSDKKTKPEEPVTTYRRSVADFPDVQSRFNTRERGQQGHREAAPTPTPLPPEGLSFSAWKEDKPSPTPTPLAVTQPADTHEARGQELPPDGQTEAQPIVTSETRRETEDVGWAPFGRLVKCELVNTVDSYCPLTPIIGLVTEDVWFDGKLIVPVGSEVHGKSAPCNSTAGGRIGSQGPWVIVLPSTARYRKGGREWTVKGRVLDMSQTAGEETWGITDGSYGMAGTTISTSDKNEVRLFVAEFMAAMAQGLQSTHTNNYTGQIIPNNTVQNGALSGVSEVMKDYSQQVMEAIKRDGSYTRVPAGKQFYLYIEQSLDETDAQRNRSKAAQNQFEADAKSLQEQGKTSNPLQSLIDQISTRQPKTLPDSSSYRNNNSTPISR